MSYNRQLLIKAILLWSLGATILRGLRFPGYYAVNQWLVDYRFGFIKRGLPGSVLSAVTGLVDMKPTEEIIVALALGALLLYCLTLIILGLRIIKRMGWTLPAVLIMLVFFVSPSVVINAFTIGLFDSTLFVLAVISIALLLKGNIILASCLQAVSVLIHENTLLISLPVFCFAWLIFNQRQKETKSFRTLPFWPLMLPVGVFFALVVYQQFFLSQDLQMSLIKHFSEFSFLDPEKSLSLAQHQTTKFSDYYAWQRFYFFSRLVNIPTAGIIVPSVLAILFFTLKAFGIRARSLHSILIICVCFLPQIMHLVAWDTLRIWSYSIPVSFLVLWVYSELFPARRDVPLYSPVLCLIAMAISITVSNYWIQHYTAPSGFSLSTRLLLYAPLAGLLLIRYPVWRSRVFLTFQQAVRGKR